MEYFNDFLSRVLNLLSEFLFIFNRTLFKIGDSEISIGTIVVFFASFYLLIVVSKNVRLILLNKILAKSKLKKSFRESLANGVRITMMLIGTIIIIQAVGIDLSALSLLAGALGVGIGFGLDVFFLKYGNTENFVTLKFGGKKNFNTLLGVACRI